MAKHDLSTTKIRGKIRTRVTLKRGEVLSLCRCWKSENFPLCDSTHKNLGDEKGPVIIHTECDQDFITRESD